MNTQHENQGVDPKQAPPSRAAPSPATVQAYLETEYRVSAAPPFTLRIGERSAELAALHKQHRVDCSAFITAWNPFSRALEPRANALRQEALRREVVSRSLVFIEGVGQHPDKGWPGEDSLLVLGLAQEAAKALGTRFEQSAIVWCAADAVPRLVMLDRGGASDT